MFCVDVGPPIVCLPRMLTGRWGRAKTVKTTMNIKRALDQLYTRRGSGCCLHAVVDDFNIGDSALDFCIQLAEEKGCSECLRLAKVFRALSLRERSEVLRLPEETEKEKQ